MRHPWRWLVILLLLVLIGAAGFELGPAVYEYEYDANLVKNLGAPDPEPQPIYITDTHGSPIGVTSFTGSGSEGGISRPLGQATFAQAPLLGETVMAAEDKTFFKHGCYDASAIVRSAVHNFGSRNLEGASTIAQQYARNAYQSVFWSQGINPREDSMKRKILELAIACHLESTQSKQEILNGYLNYAYFGRGAIGIEEAARAYFGTDATALSEVQAATLASTLSQPSLYNDSSSLSHLKLIRDATLATMFAQGWQSPPPAGSGLSGQQWLAQMQAEPIVLSNAPANPELDPHLTTEVRNSLEHLGYSHRILSDGGFTVQLTIDATMQKEALASLTSVLNGANDLLGAIVAIDPITGDVLAEASTVDSAHPSFDAAVQAATRQVGSAMKPFVAETALLNGYSLGATIPAPACLQANSSQICNDDNTDHGDVTMLDMLSQSINTAAVNLIQAVGPQQTVDQAHQTGLDDPFIPGDAAPSLQAVPSLALGTSGVSPYSLGCGYTHWANDGTHTTCHFIQSITWSGGSQPTYTPNVSSTQVVDPDVARGINTALMVTVASPNGTAHRLAGLVNGTQVSLAAKTGTTSSFRDARLVAYTPNLVTSVWVGYDNNAPMTNLHGYSEIFGNTLPLDIDAGFLNQVLPKLSPVAFPAPSQAVLGTNYGYSNSPTASPSSP